MKINSPIIIRTHLRILLSSINYLEFEFCSLLSICSLLSMFIFLPVNKSLLKIINPNACQKVIVSNPKITGTNQFQSNIVTQPDKKQISAIKIILATIRSISSIQLDVIKRFLRFIICLYIIVTNISNEIRIFYSTYSIYFSCSPYIGPAILYR